MVWSGRYSGGAESAGSGGMCARMLHAAGSPGHFAPVRVGEQETTENPRIRKAEPDVPDETKTERARRLERNRKVRAANRLAVEAPSDKKVRVGKGPRRGAHRGLAKQAYRRGPKNAAQMARTSQTWRRGPKIAVQMVRMSQTWRRGPKNAAQMARTNQTWRRGRKNAA